MGTLEKKIVLLCSVLLVAPSASLAGPIPAPNPSPEPHLLPWGQGLAVGSPAAISHGGYIYCAGCSPLNPQQLVINVPSNIPLSKALPAVHAVQASGVQPPEQRVDGDGAVAHSTVEGAEEPGKGKNIWNDGSVPIQQMALHDDGRYSFSYDTAHSSRQEERNLDGTVQGSYSYTDPTGKLVQIDYTAGPNKGYNAYGENVPPQPVRTLPQPVLDTPEVQEARQRFLETYNAELARIEQEQKEATEKAAAHAADSEGQGESNVAPGESSGADDTVVISSPNDEGAAAAAADHEGQAGDDAVIVAGRSEVEAENHQDNQGSEGQDDSIVISTGNSDTDSNAQNQARNEEISNDSSSSASLPSPAYQITIPIGVGANSGLSIQPGHVSPILPPQAGQHIGVQPGGVIGIPQPVQDTPEVQEARQRFIEAYNKELERIQKAHQEAAERAQNAQISVTETGNELNNNNNNENNANVNANSVNENANAKSNLQPYFYYVSVGGAPHYITSIPQPGRPSPYPTSLKATLLGAVPLAAVHDTQVPNRGNNAEQNNNGQAQVLTGAAIRPVFLDLENTVQEGQKQESADQTSLQNNNNNNQHQQQQSVRVNPIVGQLVPLSLTPVNTGAGGIQIGYIPGIILNHANTGASGQNVQGSQSNVNVAQPLPAGLTFSFNVPQQNDNQQQQQAATSSSSSSEPSPALNQPIIVLAAKK